MHLLRSFGRAFTIGTAKYLPLTQTSGGGPTLASICEDGDYHSGQLFVRQDGVVVFLSGESLEEVRKDLGYT